MRTYMATASDIKPKWYLVDASGKTLGRLASELALRLRGKHKPEFTPHMDTGDFFVVVNMDKIHLTGNKRQEKLYYRHSEYPGGLKTENFATLLDRKPGSVLELAVKGMLPRGPLGRKMLKKLKVYAGADHPHKAQNPRTLVLGEKE